MTSISESKKSSAGTTTKHSDERGFFQELYHFNDEDVAQISWFSIEPGKWRGGHMHVKTLETFIVLEGSVCYMESVRLSLPSKDKDVIVSSWSDTHLMQSQSTKSRIGAYHAFYSEHGAKILVLSNRHFNANAPDTYSMPSEEIEKHIEECVKKPS